MVPYIIALLLIFILSYIWLRKINSYAHITSFKYRLPLIGHFLRMELDTTKVIKRINSLYNEIGDKTAIFWIFSKPILTTMDVSHFETVLRSSELINKGFSYNLLKGWLGTGLLISTGDLWKKRRKMLTPAFHFNILSSNFHVMRKHAVELVKHLKATGCGSLVEFSALSKRFSLGVLCETSMGVEHSFLNFEDSTDVGLYIKAIDFLTRTACARFRFPPYMSERFFKWFSPQSNEYYKQLNYAKTFTRNIIENRIKSLELKGGTEPVIFLDILISSYNKGEIDIEGIIDEVNTFMFEGHDTVSSAISWIIYLLGRDERVQDKLFNEIHSLNVNELQYNDLQSLVYAEYVIKESLRLHPPVPMIIRQIAEDCNLESNLSIPKDTEFIFHIYQLQRDESNWKDAEKFYPERFQDRFMNSQNPFSFVPFSAGPRNCIGQRFAMMEMKLALYYLLNSFRFVSIHSEEEILPEVEVIHKAANGIWVNVAARE